MSPAFQSFGVGMYDSTTVKMKCLWVWLQIITSIDRTCVLVDNYNLTA